MNELGPGTLWSKPLGGLLTPREVAVIFADDYFAEPVKLGPVVSDGPCRLGDQRYTFRLRGGVHTYCLRLDIEGVWTVSIREEPINAD